MPGRPLGTREQTMLLEEGCTPTVAWSLMGTAGCRGQRSAERGEVFGEQGMVYAKF
jgi:hypothetical protein